MVADDADGSRDTADRCDVDSSWSINDPMQAREDFVDTCRLVLASREMSSSQQSIPRKGRITVTSEDPRAMRTRTKLVEAFTRLADSGPVTVAALTGAAGVHRSVFYKHFASPDDLAVYMLRDLFTALSDADVRMRGLFAVDGLAASRSAMSAFVGFIDARRAVYAPLLGSHAPAGAVRRITEAFTELTATALDQMTTRPPEVDTAVLAPFLAHGVLGVVGRWLDDEESKGSQEQVVEQLVLCFPSWLAADSTKTSTSAHAAGNQSSTNGRR